MTKMIWIVAAVVVIGVGIAAGLNFAGGNEPAAIAAADTAKGAGLGEASGIGSDTETVAASEPTQSPPVVGMSTRSASSPPVVHDENAVTAVASIDELIASAAALEYKEVIVRGTIVTQCIVGCQFSLEDGTGVIGVELVDDALDNVLSGGSVGRRVEVRGTIERSPNLVILVEEPDGWRYLD